MDLQVQGKCVGCVCVCVGLGKKKDQTANSMNICTCVCACVREHVIKYFIGLTQSQTRAQLGLWRDPHLTSTGVQLFTQHHAQQSTILHAELVICFRIFFIILQRSSMK